MEAKFSQKHKNESCRHEDVDRNQTKEIQGNDGPPSPKKVVRSEEIGTIGR